MTKPPKPRIHIVDSPIPLLSYSGLKARCGAEILHGEHQFSYEAEYLEKLEKEYGYSEECSMDSFENVLFSRLTCRRCLKARPVEEKSKRYLYGLVEAQEELLAKESA
jgi:hypothetical protein